MPTIISMVPGLPSGAVCSRSVLIHLRTWQCLRMPTFLHATPPSASRSVLYILPSLSSIMIFAESQKSPDSYQELNLLFESHQYIYVCVINGNHVWSFITQTDSTALLYFLV